MPNETEKLTINLGVVELAQIDVLVEQGIFSNRSDFIRTAVRNHIDAYREMIERQAEPMPGKKEWIRIIGIYTLTRKALENLAKENEKISLSVVGMLVVNADVSAELFEKTVENAIVKGKIAAPNEIREIIAKMG